MPRAGLLDHKEEGSNITCWTTLHIGHTRYQQGGTRNMEPSHTLHCILGELWVQLRLSD